MRKLSKYQLSLLSLLVPIGYMVIGLTLKTNFIWIAYLIVFVGSFAFGTLLNKEKNN